MDRYIIREPRAGVDYPEGNQMISFPTTNTESTFGTPQSMYHSYGPESQGYMTHITHGAVVTPAQTFGSNFYQNQGHIVSGIDPRYLAAYSDTNGSYIATGQRECPSTSFDLFGSYQNRDFMGPERSDYKHYPQRTHVATLPETNARPYIIDQHRTFQHHTTRVEPKPTEVDLVKKEEQVQVKTRVEKIQEIRKVGTRVLCGTVEKILKWNRSLQDIGVMALYELVVKCVSVSPGDRSAQNLVVRDENGPAMQVVYYEIDLLLPELSLPCTVRVVGRMLSGSNRMQGFSVRVARADDVTALTRRTAIAMKQVEELIQKYGGCT